MLLPPSLYFVGLLLPMRLRNFSLEKGIDAVDFPCGLLEIVGIASKSRSPRRRIVPPKKFNLLWPGDHGWRPNAAVDVDSATRLSPPFV